MKTASRFLMIAAIAGAAQAAPFLAMGDNAELFLTGAAKVSYDDNIYLATTKAKSDLILSVTPGFDLVFGKGSATTGNFYYREEFQAYTDHDQQNTTLSNVGVNTRFDSGKSKYNFGASYAQLAMNTSDLRGSDQIVRREVINVGGDSEFGLSEKTSLGIAIKFDNTDYSPKGFTDLESWTLPIDVYYKYSEKLETSVGYRYRDNKLGGTALDNQDHFFSLGARGEFTPKVKGQVRMGYTQRTFERGSDQSAFGLEGSLTYADSEKTSYQFNFSNDFGNAATGDSTKNFSLGVSANANLTEQWAMNAGLNYRGSKYPTRKDDFVTAQVGVTYNYNAFVNFNAGYNYTDNRSDSRPAEFTDNMFYVGAGIRY